MGVGYEILDSGRGAEHRIGYHKLIYNKHEWNNCFISLGKTTVREELMNNTTRN